MLHNMVRIANIVAIIRIFLSYVTMYLSYMVTLLSKLTIGSIRSLQYCSPYCQIYNSVENILTLCYLVTILLWIILRAVIAKAGDEDIESRTE